MFTRLLTVWERVRSSLWALPLVMVVVAVVLAMAALTVSPTFGQHPGWWLYSGDAKVTPEFLSDLLSSMITMGTLAISITMVVLTLAAQHLGPRLINSFIADWRTQASLGLFLATTIYLLVILRSAYGSSDGIPNLAVTLGTALVILSVVTLTLFVSHLARSIVADSVIMRVGNSLDAAARSLLPDPKDADEPAAAGLPDWSDGEPIRLPGGGYVQAIDYGHLVEVARHEDAHIALARRPGQHAIANDVFAWGHPRTADIECLRQAVEKAVVLGGERTAVQDIEYAVRQLVEICLRALSPGVSDPYTATAVIDRLALSLSLMMKRGEAPRIWRDDDGGIRVIGPISSFSGIVDGAFLQIRQYGMEQPAVLIRLAEKLSELIDQAPPRHRPVLIKHIDLVLEAGRQTIRSEFDLKALEERARWKA